MFDADLEDSVMFKGSFKRISNLTCLSLDFAVRTNKLVSFSLTCNLPMSCHAEAARDVTVPSCLKQAKQVSFTSTASEKYYPDSLIH